MLHEKLSEAFFRHLQHFQLFDLIFLRDSFLYLCQWDAQAGQEAEFGVGSSQIVDGAQAVLLFDVCELDAGLFANLAAYGCAWVGLGVGGVVTVAFKEAADDVVAADVDIDALAFVEQDVVVAGLYDGTDGEGIAEFLAVAAMEKFGDARGDVFFVACVSQDEMECATWLRRGADETIERGIEERDMLLLRICQFLCPDGIDPALDGGTGGHAQ